MVMVFFFFQAEDGIRDSSVTGVQTCALPISAAGPRFYADFQGVPYWKPHKICIKCYFSTAQCVTMRWIQANLQVPEGGIHGFWYDQNSTHPAPGRKA